MDTVRRWARRPEIVIPVAVLAVATVVVGAVLAIFRPESSVAAAIVAAVAAVLGSALSLTLGRYFEKERELELQVRAKKIPEYEKFTAFWLDAIYRDKLGKKPFAEREMLQAMIDWTKPLLMWGSDDVIRDWGRFRIQFDPQPNKEPPTDEERGKIAVMFAFEELLLQFRRDAGYPDTDLKRGDLLRLWVNDIDRYI